LHQIAGVRTLLTNSAGSLVRWRSPGGCNAFEPGLRSCTGGVKYPRRAATATASSWSPATGARSVERREPDPQRAAESGTRFRPGCEPRVDDRISAVSGDRRQSAAVRRRGV